MKKIAILGGGTFSPVRNHLSLCAPAFGTTARQIQDFLNSRPQSAYYDVQIYLTKMANGASGLVTNQDVEKLIDRLIADKETRTIILNVAFCDYDVVDDQAGFHGERFKTSDGDISLHLTPSKKVIDKIRRERPDIFLVGFKTTTNASDEDQFLTALKMMKRSKCNLVLANDTVTRKNMIITPEESKYVYNSRGETLQQLCQMILDRHNLTYNRTEMVEDVNHSVIKNAPSTFKIVLKHLIDNGGFIENNGNGFTPGHFCYKLNSQHFVSSQRKVNHNDVFKNGMTKIEVNGNTFTGYGTHKPSVGARSQWIMFGENPDYDCIIHTHTPLKKDSLVPVASQKEFQCGSLECGVNTVTNLKTFGNIRAVYLDKHGYNIMFKSSGDPQEVIDFIEDNFELGIKTT